MVAETLSENPQRPIILFHSSRTLEEVVFKKHWDEWAEQHPSFRIHSHLTRELASVPGVFHSHIDGQGIRTALAKLIPEQLAATEFLISGSIPFARDLWRSLRDLGISEEMILTEAFFS